MTAQSLLCRDAARQLQVGCEGRGLLARAMPQVAIASPPLCAPPAGDWAAEYQPHRASQLFQVPERGLWPADIRPVAAFVSAQAQPAQARTPTPACPCCPCRAAPPRQALRRSLRAARVQAAAVEEEEVCPAAKRGAWCKHLLRSALCVACPSSLVVRPCSGPAPDCAAHRDGMRHHVSPPPVPPCFAFCLPGPVAVP